MCVRACAVRVCVVCVRACVRVRVRVRVRACARACARACVRVSVCARARVRACVRVRAVDEDYEAHAEAALALYRSGEAQAPLRCPQPQCPSR